ncbi:MAG: helix-turn-helix transcriptional regulator [Rhizobiales bacterium]|nr:helix-turn-helix transcriptional regulator [Hyphomicrobiales bacterium]MBI3673454.1 helix-turn-helix transcriptional regulator [Hyphomicrobiales bacterium]
MNRPEKSPDIGARLKALRKERGASLAELARATGVSEATLSRVENGQSLVSAHHLYQLSRTLGVDITAFFEAGGKTLAGGIRSICRRGDGVPLSTARYEAQVLCTDIAAKHMHPAINTVTIASLAEAGGFSRHDGEEFLHVLLGRLLLVTEFYEPLLLETGDSVYFDSHMGHAYLSPDGRPVQILVIATTEPPK